MRMFIPSLLVLVVAACGTLTTYQSAEPLPAGRWQGMAALGVGVYNDQAQATKTPTVPIELGARRGVGGDTDVGLKLYTFGVEASVRHRLVAGTWSYAVLGALGGVKTGHQYDAIPEAWLGQLRLGGVATRRTSSRFAWNVGPTATGSLWIPAGGGYARGVMIGVFGGFDWRFATCWHLIPELSLHRTIAGDYPVDQSAAMFGAAFARDW